jgi:hypothetical protein
LKPFSGGSVAGTSIHDSRCAMGSGRSGFHVDLGVAAAGWILHPRSPATADPCVPSTCSSNSSSRFTRTAHDEFICTTRPPSNSKIA